MSPLFFIVPLYLLFRLPFLTRLAIFTDETNYLDWGYRMTHAPDHLFYSLYDAKQPLVMWFFGLAQNLFSDPLLAGRLVSVATGLLTLLGLYKLARDFFDHRIALLASTIYSLTPLFLLFDRQALMESALAAVGVWSAYFFLQLLRQPADRPRIWPALGLGFVLGLGFFTKTSALLFLAPLPFLSLLFRRSISYLLLSATVFAAVIFPLLLQPYFWSTFRLNTRYSGFPSSAILSNLDATAQVLFWQFTPLLFLASCLGLVRLFRSRHLPALVVTLWVFLPLTLQVLAGAYIVSRYVVLFLPLLVIPAAHLLLLRRPADQFKPLLIPLVLLPGLIFSVVQILNPVAYFRLLARLTRYSYIEGYVTHEASGYSAQAALQYLNSLEPGQRLVIGLGLFSGNPEAAILLYLNRHPRLFPTYLDAQLFGSGLAGFDCLSYPQPVYLVTRDPGAAGLSKFVTPVADIPNPYGQNITRIFKLNSDCQGRTLRLNLTRSKTF